jgi:hypothetical protein
VSVTAADAGGVKSVTLTWFDPTGAPHNKAMKHASGSTWTVVLNENVDPLFSGNNYPMRATAVDIAGNRSTGGTGSFDVEFCIT